uniref:C2H2-type domain-containing protein n=1 Tax=Timema douglasi TaxID=61478 RepID=A0A7R8VPY7_TIMDO|nr:unnamed protein product [Timema douglasi]
MTWLQLKNETESHATQHILESNNEAVVHYIIKPETPSIIPASGVCGELELKEELCIDESSIIVSENKIKAFIENFTNEINKNVEFQAKDEQLIHTSFLYKETIIYQKDRKNNKCDDYIKSYGKNINPEPPLIVYNEKNSHNCEVCGKCFKTNGELNTHLVIHDEQTAYKCDVCGKYFKIKHQLRVHLITHGEHRPHKCDVFGKLSRLRATLVAISLLIENKVPTNVVFVANVSKPRALLSFISLLTMNKENTNNEIVSRTTQYILESNNEAVDHYIIKSETASIVPASRVCGELGLNEELCFDESSIIVIRDTYYLPKGWYKYNCDDYIKSYTKNIKLKAHILAHSKQKPHKCEFWGKVFKRKCGIKIHFITQDEKTLKNVRFVARVLK